MSATACIVLPVDGPTTRVLACLTAIGALAPEPSFEVVVAAEGAPWLTPLLRRLEGDVRVLDRDPPQGGAATLRDALAHTEAEIVALLTGEAVPGPGWLGELCTALRDPSVGTAYSAGGTAGAASAVQASGAAWRAADLRSVVVDTLVAPATDAIAHLSLALAERGLPTRAVAASAIDRPAPAARPAAPGTAPELTIVIPTLDATAPRVQRCLQLIRATTEVAHEVVIVDNGASPQGFTGPVNTGVRSSRAPYVVVMNDDVEPLPGWWPPLRDALDAGAAVSFPLTIDGAMRTDFAAWCFAVSRATVQRHGHASDAFFDPSLVVWFQDTDLLTRLRADGNPPQLVRDSRIRHGLSQTLADPEPQLSAWIRDRTAADHRRFAAKHPDAELVAVAI